MDAFEYCDGRLHGEDVPLDASVLAHRPPAPVPGR
jgi:hypothetical protein